MAEFNYTANGTINPSTFVMIDPTTSDRVISAGSPLAPIVGVAQEWSKLAPIPGATSEAADAGDQIKVYQQGEVCLLQCTASGWTARDLLTGSGGGLGVTAVSGNWYGAIAMETLTGPAGALGRVQVIAAVKYP